MNDPAKHPAPYYFLDGDLYLTLKVIPRASRSEWLGVEDHYIKVKIMAPPVEGKANQAIVKFLSGIFGVAPTYITQISGYTAREKRFRIPNPKKLPIDIIMP